MAQTSVIVNYTRPETVEAETTCGSRTAEVEQQPIRGEFGIVRLYGRQTKSPVWSQVMAYDPGSKAILCVDPPPPSVTEKIEDEEVVFEGGVGKLKYPAAPFSAQGPQGRWKGSPLNLTSKSNSKIVRCPTFEARPDVYIKVTALVSYDARCSRWKIPVPLGYPSEAFEVEFRDASGQCPTLKVGMTLKPVDSNLLHDVRIVTYDHITGNVVSGVGVFVDQAFEGNTSSGEIVVSIASGDHDIRFSKAGYLDSADDGLANDKLTVGDNG